MYVNMEANMKGELSGCCTWLRDSVGMVASARHLGASPSAASFHFSPFSLYSRLISNNKRITYGSKCSPNDE